MTCFYFTRDKKYLLHFESINYFTQLTVVFFNILVEKGVKQFEFSANLVEALKSRELIRKN